MIYLDNAATTFPKPQCLSDEITKCIKRYCGNPGRSSHSLSVKSAEKIYEARCFVGDLVSTEPENVIFTYNTTYALNFAINSFVQYGDHVLISDIEHNSVYRPVEKLRREGKITYDIFSTYGDCNEIIENITKKIMPKTSVLICNHASNIGSRVLPIREIGTLCKKHSIKFIVDGAQSVGIYKIDVKDMSIDALCIPAHKGLYGPQGLGMIAFGDDFGDKILISGGTGINSNEANMPDFLPERFEPGTMSTPLIAGLSASLKWLLETGTEKIRKHEEMLYCTFGKLAENFPEIKVYELSKSPGNTILFNVDGFSCSKISELLSQREICVRSGLHCSPLAHRLTNTVNSGGVRVSFGVFNTKNDVYRLFEALEDILKKEQQD